MIDITASRISHLASRIFKAGLALLHMALLASFSNAQTNNTNSNNTIGHFPGTSGLTGEYVSDQGSFTSRIDSAPDTTLVLPTGMDSAHPFTVAWSGYLSVATTGTYTVTIDLGATHNQLSVVTLNNASVYSYSKNGPTINTSSTPVYLVAGQKYPIWTSCFCEDTTMSPKAFLTQGTTQTPLTSSNFNPAVVPNTPVDTVSYVAPDGATSAWTITDTPASINVYRYAVGSVNGIYHSVINNVAATVTTYKDQTGQEGVDTEYDIKEVYNNPVTGGETLGPATGSDVQMPYQIMNNPVNTGNGKVTLFFSAPPTTVSFRIYMDSSAGTPTNLIVSGPTSKFQDTRYGQTNSYVWSINSPAGNTEYYTIQALDANGIVLHTSLQVDWVTGSAGIPWDSANLNNLGQVLYQSLVNGEGGGGADYLDCIGPNMILYSVANGTSTTYQTYEPGSQDYEKLSQPFFSFPTSSDGLPFFPSTNAQNNPVFGSAAGPYDQYRTIDGFAAISSVLSVPDRASGSNFNRQITSGGPDVFCLYEGGTYRNLQGEQGAIDAGIAWDVNQSNKSVSNNFWSPVLNISSSDAWVFYDKNLPLNLSQNSRSNHHLQVNGTKRIYFPPSSNGFTCQMSYSFGDDRLSPGNNGFVQLVISGQQGFQVCDKNQNLYSGSTIVLAAYVKSTRHLDLTTSSVKLCSSIAQAGVDEPGIPTIFQTPYVQNGSQMLNWFWGDSSGFFPVQISQQPNFFGLQSWANEPIGYWFVSPSYGLFHPVEPGPYSKPSPFTYLPGSIDLRY